MLSVLNCLSEQKKQYRLKFKLQRSSSVELMRTAKSSEKSPGPTRGTTFILHISNGSKYHGSFMARVGTCVNNQPTEEALKRLDGVMSETQGGAKIVPDDVREHETESNT